MNYIRPLSNAPKAIVLSDSQKSALATAMREASENVRQAEPLCVSAPEPTGESRLAGSEELVFIL